MSVPRQSSVWDERRNTSATFGVPPTALPDALRALAAWRRADPAMARWLADGHPTLTDAEHVARFGEPFRGRARKASA